MREKRSNVLFISVIAIIAIYLFAYTLYGIKLVNDKTISSADDSSIASPKFEENKDNDKIESKVDICIQKSTPIIINNCDNNYVYSCSDDELKFFEQILAAESYSYFSYNDMLSLATVIINRYNSPEFPNSFEEIFKEDRQFETFSNKSYETAIITEECKQAVEDALKGKTNLNSDVLYFCTKDYYENCSEDDFFKLNVKHVYTCRNIYFFENM